MPPPSTPPLLKKKKVPSADAVGLKVLARERLREAQILFRRGKFDGAGYLCGYAVELALKARICRTLGWSEYKVGRDYGSFKIHDLDILLDLSGARPRITTRYLGEWSAVLPEWGPELRYAPVGHMKRNVVSDMIEATRKLLKVI